MWLNVGHQVIVAEKRETMRIIGRTSSMCMSDEFIHEKIERDLPMSEV